MENILERNKLISRIWALGKENSMDSDDIHAIVYRETGKESIKKCTDKQLVRVINALKFMAGMEEARRGKATRKQLQYIADLEFQLGWSDAPERLRGFLRSQYGTENVKWLTVKQASNLIEALKSILGQERKREGVCK